MTVLATDDFNRADGSLGASWTTISAQDSPQIVGNLVQDSATGAVVAASLYTAITWPNDQYSQVSVQAATALGRVVGAVCRGNVDARNYYTAQLTGPLSIAGTAGVSCRLFRISAGVTASIATSTLLTAIVGSTVRCEARGTTIRAFVDGVERLSGTDATFVSGNAGILVLVGAGGVLTNAQLDDFEGGDFITGRSISRSMLMGVGI